MSERKQRLPENLVELSGEEMAQVQGGIDTDALSGGDFDLPAADGSIVISSGKSVRFKAGKPID
jgi:hypothetical protein